MTEFTVYHVSEAGQPNAHDTAHGEWFFEPENYSSGDVYSEGYSTKEEAEQAAIEWFEQQEAERAEEQAIKDQMDAEQQQAKSDYADAVIEWSNSF